jgi:hypothetical protein
MPDENIIEDIETECKRIDKLFEEYEPLLEKIKDRAPDFIEIGSLAMMLHSFYNGLENIFSRIARKIDKNMPEGLDWHKELLDLMSKPTKKRKYVVLSNDMGEELKKYLGFRHFSRHAYAFDLDWELMKDLVFRSDDVRKKVLDEIESFIKKIKEE